jgi:hypothetical protein
VTDVLPPPATLAALRPGTRLLAHAARGEAVRLQLTEAHGELVDVEAERAALAVGDLLAVRVAGDHVVWNVQLAVVDVGAADGAHDVARLLVAGGLGTPSERALERTACSLAARVRLGGHVRPARTVDVSPLGLRLVGALDLRVGEEVSIELGEVRNLPVQLHARVCRLEWTVGEVALEVIALDLAAWRRLERTIRPRHSPLNTF